MRLQKSVGSSAACGSHIGMKDGKFIWIIPYLAESYYSLKIYTCITYILLLFLPKKLVKLSL